MKQWFSSPLGQRITKMEESASAGDVGDPMAQYKKGGELLRSMPEPRRAALAELTRITRSAEYSAELLIETSVAAAEGAASVTPEAPRPAMADLRQMFEARRGQLTKDMTAMAMASFANAYETLPTTDLKAYLVFLKSDAGRHYNDACMKAFLAALKDAASEFGRQLAIDKHSIKS